ncbi:DinB family protein [Paenibacillus flagellatus]|uniref:Damage-inducible protein DinB n=1 Tax=Paenibacillus flagellatus TaxID=2211139 RepID=A0A2V5JZD6_9BACL|nr:DinB family protein [Paenibacillus flagellatus]PYI50684.1 hypothetical protein DLM86_28350 [Paenibacillus flagellatus]
MFTTIETFEAEWRQESATTQKVMDALTDETLAREVAPGFRTLGRLAWHIVTQIHQTAVQTGLELPSPGSEENVPASARELADAYRRTSEALLDAVRSQWTDAKLSETNQVFGQSWPNGLTLRIIIQHEVHHRGQMTVLMRQAGLRVPDVYGPTKEMWGEMGAPEPAL